jgi:hypothetical protein
MEGRILRCGVVIPPQGEDLVLPRGRQAAQQVAAHGAEAGGPGGAIGEPEEFHGESGPFSPIFTIIDRSLSEGKNRKTREVKTIFTGDMRFPTAQPIQGLYLSFLLLSL